MARQIAMQFVIKRMHRLLDPGEGVTRQRLGVGKSLRTREGAVAVDGERHAGLEHGQGRLDPPNIFGQGDATDLDLESPMSSRDGPANLLAQLADIVVLAIMAATRIDIDHVLGGALVTLRKISP